jgi:hypothetical protein
VALALTLLLPLLASCVATRRSNLGPVSIASFGVALPAANATPTQSVVIVPGQTVLLTWSVTGATSLSISDGSTVLTNLVAYSGDSIEVTPTTVGTHIYTLTATNPNGTVSTPAYDPTLAVAGTTSTAAVDSTVTVAVVANPAINTFTVTPSSIYSSQSTTLQWTTNGAEAGLVVTACDPAAYLTDCPGRSGNYGQTWSLPQGTTSLMVSPTLTTIYQLQAVAQSAIATAATAYASVTVTPAPLLTVTLQAASSSILTGNSTTLSWTVTNTDQLTLVANGVSNDLTSVLASGSYSISPTVDTTYQLIATNKASGIQATSNSLTIEVSSCPPPNILQFATGPAASTGPGGKVYFDANFNPGGTAGATATATIEPGIGTITVGTPAQYPGSAGGDVWSSALNSSTTFTLTVTNSCNATSTQTVRVPVGDISLYAGSSYGYQIGTLLTAQFTNITGMASDSSGNLYVADNANYVIEKITPGVSGQVTNLAGIPGKLGTGTTADDGPIGSALFSNPSALAIDYAENVYVLDDGGTSLRVIWQAPSTQTYTNGYVYTLASGLVPGTNSYILGNAQAIAVDAKQNIYVTSQAWNSILKITNGDISGTGTTLGTVTTLAGAGDASTDTYGAGWADGTGTAAQFYDPRGITVDANGNLYVAEGYDQESLNNGTTGLVGNRDIRMVTPAGVVTTIAGTHGVSGTSDGVGICTTTVDCTPAQFSHPSAIAIDASSGYLYVLDYVAAKYNFLTDNAYAIRRITPQIDGSYTVDSIVGSFTGFNNSTASYPLSLPGLLGSNTYTIVADPTSGYLFFSNLAQIFDAAY